MLDSILASAAAGSPPAADGVVRVVPPPDSRSVGVFAFTAHHVVSADVDPGSHPRAVVHQRCDVHMWTVGDGFALLGKGVAGRYEVATPGRGLGPSLFAAVLGEAPAGVPVWAQVAPGNVAPLRALPAAGYRPVGAEVLLV